MKATNADAAFAALKSYDHGSSRATLLPLDEAVQACLTDKPAREQLEQRLLAALKSSASGVAREYVCSKLAWIASPAAVPSLAALLDDPQAATAARSALEKLPGPQASKALRQSLARLSGLHKIGAIASLGARRDADSVTALASLLTDPDPALAAAAVAALGDIASSKAAKTLIALYPRAPASIRSHLADTMIACAERLATAGRTREAIILCQTLDSPAQPPHIRTAARKIPGQTRPS